MAEFIKTINLPSGRTLNIGYEDDGYNPLEEYDRIETIITTSNRYFEGDEIISAEWEDEKLEIEAAGGVVVPLYMLVHSGITLSLSGFNDPWDSGCVGFCYVTREKLDKEYKGHTLEKAQECALKRIEGDIEDVNKYLNGEVYYLELDDENGEHLESIGYLLDDFENIHKAALEFFDMTEEDEKFISNL